MKINSQWVDLGTPAQVRGQQIHVLNAISAATGIVTPKATPEKWSRIAYLIMLVARTEA